MGWERIVYTRKELFDQVWAEPVMHVAKRIGISDVALAKVCRGMDIPLPGRGHWARKAAGNAPSKPTLGPAKSGAPGGVGSGLNRVRGRSRESKGMAFTRSRVRSPSAPPALTPT